MEAQPEPGAHPPVPVPMDVAERIDRLWVALPEVTVRVDRSRTGTRSTAVSSDIRRRWFCLLVAKAGSAGRPVPLLVVRSEADERQALVSVGHLYFVPRAGGDRLGVLLTDDTDGDEIAELVTDSYRIPAPKKVGVLPDTPP